MQSSLGSLLSLVLVLSSTSNASVLTPRADGDCTDVHIFLAKGNNEPYPGRQGKLIEAICRGLKSCDYEDIQFYNPLPAPYCESVAEGAANGVKQITAYNKRCPKSKLVVSGYSQGGHVLGDVLGGGGGVFFEDCVQPANKGLSPKTAPGNKIAAALIFGDVRHTANQPYNVLGGSGSNGIFPRSGEQLANLGAFSSVLRAYCATNDPICAGGEVVAEHLNYFDVYSEDAAKWVKEMVGAEEEAPSSTEKPQSSTKASSTEAATSEPGKPTSTSADSSSKGQSQSTTAAPTESSPAPKTSSKSEPASTTKDDAPAESTSEEDPEPADPDNAAMSLRTSFTAVALLVAGFLAL